MTTAPIVPEKFAKGKFLQKKRGRPAKGSPARTGRVYSGSKSLCAQLGFQALEEASLQTLNEGVMTKDLCALAEGITPTPVDSDSFIKAIRQRLEAKLGA